MYTVYEPSSKFVPAMKGRRAKCPELMNVEATSGKIPPGASIVGSNPKNSGASAFAWLTPLKISDVFAFLKQSKVFGVLANDAHEATPETKFCQSISRRAASNSNAVPAEPDWKILENHEYSFSKSEKMTYTCSSQLFNWSTRVQEEYCWHDCTSTFSKHGDLDIMSVLAIEENVPLLKITLSLSPPKFSIFAWTHSSAANWSLRARLRAPRLAAKTRVWVAERHRYIVE